MMPGTSQNGSVFYIEAQRDLTDSVRQVTENASKLGADLSKGFIVGGVSAGANLAAIVAHLARDEKLSPPVTGSLLQVPLTLSLESIDEKYRAEVTSPVENAEAPILNVKTVGMLLGELISRHWVPYHRTPPYTNELVRQLQARPQVTPVQPLRSTNKLQ